VQSSSVDDFLIGQQIRFDVAHLAAPFGSRLDLNLQIDAHYNTEENSARKSALAVPPFGF
jgi:hypothetical protein